jgi:GNAT superfamily N-acetyltransferase
LPDSTVLPGLQVRAPASTDEWLEMYQLRWQILRQPWNQPVGSERDEYDDTACHRIAILPDFGIIGTGRLHQTKQHEGQVRYMAVRPEYRNKGIGKAILTALEDHAKSTGIQRITLHAREAAMPFYRDLGYELIKKSHLLFDTIQHHEMQKSL